MHYAKVNFFVPEFPSSKIINHRFHFNNDKVDYGIGYDIIIDRDLMKQLGLISDFKHQVFQRYGATLHIKAPISMLGKSNLNNREMREVVM